VKSRLIASIAIGAAVILGATGCSMMSPQGTTIPYSPSDGMNVPAVPGAPLIVRNAMVITEDGNTGNFIAAIINDTAEDATLTISAKNGSISETVDVPAHTNKSLGVDAGAEPVRLEGIDTPAGATLDMQFQSGDATAIKLHIPVLDGTLPYYKGFVPTPMPTLDATPSPTPSQ